MFTLHSQLENDTIVIGDFQLSKVLLMNDARYPWLILVPKRQNLTEIHQLSSADQQQLIAESSFVSEQMMRLFKADKMNVAALGNMVPQLHLHHVARFKDDACWPKPIWGVGEATAYSETELEDILKQIRQALSQRLV